MTTKRGSSEDVIAWVQEHRVLGNEAIKAQWLEFLAPEVGEASADLAVRVLMRGQPMNSEVERFCHDHVAWSLQMAMGKAPRQRVA